MVLSSETTYTPSGDENLLTRGKVRVYRVKQLTPRQGTKTLVDEYDLYCFKETTHAPSGDENCTYTENELKDAETTHAPSGDENMTSKTKILHPLGNNSRPVRGRKREFRVFVAFIEQKQLTPRQGTKTSYKYHPENNREETTYAPSGDENPKPPGATLL